MSQIYKPLTSSGPIPPIIATSYVTDNGTAVPSANILLVNGKFSNENNANGIIVKGGVVGTGTSNEVDVVYTNRYGGSVVTIDATPTVCAVCALPTLVNSTYTFYSTATAYDRTNSVGASIVSTFCFRTNGGPPTVLGKEDFLIFSDANFFGNFLWIASNTSLTLQITGVAATNISWNAVGYYVVAT